MPQSLVKRLFGRERPLRDPVVHELASAAGRRAAWRHFTWVDHGFLRAVWTNLAEIAPGVYRANQPSPRQLAAYSKMGIRSILNLRGAQPQSFYLLEEEACAALGLALHNARIKAQAIPAAAFLELLDTFEQVERPVLMHCKSGADRTGIAAALWLLHMEGAGVEQAMRQLSLRHIHLRWTRKGVLGAILRHYAEDTREQPMPIRDWFKTRYDPDAIEAAFAGRAR
jgi:protein tyrosine phosphatase (PTP) superfamily phosphohydrolase (DUF442 family)